MDKSLKIALILTAADKMSNVIGGAVAKTEARLKSFNKTTKQVSDKAFGFAGDTGKMGLGAAAILAGPLKAAADMEKMQVSLRTAYGGSADAATKAFSMINSFAAKTPYELEEVMKAHVKLKNMGLDPSTQAMTAYGNTATAMGNSMNDMIEEVADDATGEFERLKEFGIRSSSQGNKVTFTFQGVKTTVKKESAAIEAYLKKIGNTKFAGGIEEQSKTISGQYSTLTDNIKLTAATTGKTLIPILTDLFKKIQPIIEKIALWVEKNPELVKNILMAVAAFAAINLTLSAGAIVVGTISKTLMVLGNVLKFTSTALKFVGTSLMWVMKLIIANPILLAVAALAVGVYYVIKYWDQIKGFFAKLWKSVTAIFLTTWNWIKNLFLSYTPAGLVIKHWSKITKFFSDLWTKVKGVFTGFVEWITGLGDRFFQAGSNIVNSIWRGIKSMINKPIDAIKGMVTKIRNLLPFSPAKEGPLRDIHRIKLVETIVSNIKVKPAVDAMRRVTNAMAGPVGGINPTPAIAAPSGGNITLHYAPVINGGGSNIIDELKKHDRQLLRMIDEAVRKRDRTRYS